MRAGVCSLLLLAGIAWSQPAVAQSPNRRAPSNASATATPSDGGDDAAVTNYVIGCDDVLSITFWKDKDMSADVIVRPDGRITLPLINDVQASGFTPEQLRDRITERAKDFMDDPNLTVAVKAINSRKVFITGQIAHPGSYSLTVPTTVVQLISIAGGLTEFADAKNVVVLRTQNGKQESYRVNYKDLEKQQKVSQNIRLQPSDTIIVP
jgi:polysaccharide export outer membrane protein